MAEVDQSWRFIEAEFGDGSYRLGLRYADVIELQKVLGDVGPLVILTRLGGPWQVQDISHIIRLALIGGGLEPVAALRLVKTYVEARPALENLALAYRVLAIAVNGPVPPDADALVAGQTPGNGVS